MCATNASLPVGSSSPPTQLARHLRSLPGPREILAASNASSAPKLPPKVVGVFEADRDADHAGGDSLAGQLLVGLTAMAGRGGMADRVVCTSPRLGANGMSARLRMKDWAGLACPGRSSRSSPKPPLRSRAGEREVGVRRQAGIIDARRRASCASKRRARSSAVAQARSKRRLRVARPRRASQLSNGLPVWPSVEATARDSLDQSSAARPRAPSVRSLWPPIILVTECTTRLAPCSIGRQIERGERVVDDERNAGLARDRGQASQVGDAQQRVRDRLGEDQPRRRRHERPERTRVGGGVEDVVADPPARQ